MNHRSSLLAGALACLFSTVAWATGPTPPLSVDYAAGPPGGSTTITMTPAHEVVSVEVSRRILSDGVQLYAAAPFLHTFPPPQQGSQPPLVWQAPAPPSLPDGFYADVVNLEPLAAGAQRTVGQRSTRYFEVDGGVRTQIDLDAYSDAVLPTMQGLDRAGQTVTMTSGVSAPGTGPVTGNDGSPVHSGHDPQAPPSNSEAGQ